MTGLIKQNLVIEKIFGDDFECGKDENVIFGKMVFFNSQKINGNPNTQLFLRKKTLKKTIHETNNEPGKKKNF